jgi:prepilin-type N-terminal cleavage/methylation domain-containing protein/prepilin-type processing-associated H-X9-DG protein
VKTRDAGFTLVELMVVIAIIGVLMALLLPAVQKVRSAADRIHCSNKLKQIGLALHSYHGTYSRFPPGIGYHMAADEYPFMSWNTRLLPFLEQESVWRQAQQAFGEDPVFLDNPPHFGLTTVMPAYSCPADTRSLAVEFVGGQLHVAFTDYLGVEGTNQFLRDGLLYLNSRVRFADIIDGTSNTLMVGERPPSTDGVLGWWYAGEGQSRDGSGDMVLGVLEENVSIYGPGCSRGPYHFGPGIPNNQCDAFHFWSLHSGGANFLFADGSVHFLAYSVDDVLPALATRAGREIVMLPD